MSCFKVVLAVFLVTLAGHSKSLDWASAVSMVQQSNPELMAAKETYQATKSLETVARSGFLPNVSASVSSGQSFNELTSSESQRSESASLNLSLNLFSGFSDLNKFKEAQQNSIVAELQWRQIQSKVSSDLKVAYVGLVYAQEFVVLTEKILLRRKENLNIVQLRFASGRENKGSVLLSEAYYQQAVYDSVQASLQLNVAQNTLSQVLGIRLSEDKIAVVNDIPVGDVADLKDFDFKKMATLTLDYQKSIGQSDAARLLYEQAKSIYYPSLDFIGSMGKSDSTFPPKNDKWSIGLNLTFPLYSGGRDSANAASANYRRLSAEINQSAVSYQVLVKLRQAYSQFKLSIEKVKVDEKFKLAAQMRSEIAKKKYNNGLMSFEDWDLVENDLIQREKSNLSSFRDRVNGQANWEQTQGIGLLL